MAEEQKKKTPQEKLQEFLEKENLSLEVRMTPNAEETKSGKLMIDIEPQIVVRKSDNS